jgi:hypothetical protein
LARPKGLTVRFSGSVLLPRYFIRIYKVRSAWALEKWKRMVIHYTISRDIPYEIPFISLIP